MKAIDLVLAKPCADDVPLFCSTDVPNKLRRLVTHPLSFRRIHGTDRLPRHEARRMTPIKETKRRRCALLGMALMKHYDLVSGRVGCPRSDSFLTTDGALGYGPNKSQRYVYAPGQAGENGLAADAGLSLVNLRRSIADYRRWGWLKSSQRVVKYWSERTGTYAHYACRVVYVLTEQFFKDLEIDHKWHRIRGAASRRLGHRQRIYPLEAPQTAKAHRHHLDPGDPRGALPRGARAARRNARQLEAARAAAVEANEDDRRAEIARQMELRKLHPEWPAERIRAEAKHQT